MNKFELSQLTEAVIEARFLGPDPAVLDSLAGMAIEVMRRNPKVADARNEWGNMTPIIRPVYDPVKAGALGITKSAMMESVKSINDSMGSTIRDNEKKVQITTKNPQVLISQMHRDCKLFPHYANGTTVCTSHESEIGWEWPQMRTYNRQLSMAAMCGVKAGHTMAEVHGEIRREIESIQLPEGYTFFWDGQYKDHTKQCKQ